MSSEASIISKIEYSANLQKAILPKKRHFDRIFKDSFQIYRPAEYLSGDFYWVAQKGDLRFAAVGDCTGHGVSAAFLSMLGYNFLNYAVHSKNYINLNEVLMEIDKQFIDAFSSRNGEKYDNDWIDISIISHNSKTNEFCFAGANRKVLVVNGTDAPIILKGSKYPIGGWQLSEDRKFPVQKMELTFGEVYLGSDGFQDQFSKHHDKKIGSRQLHKILHNISSFEMDKQKERLEFFFDNWKKDEAQTDDVCLIGLRL